MKRAVAIAVLFLALAEPAGAQDYDKGYEAYKRGDYATAMRLLRPLAKHGNAEAQYYVGAMYQDGRGAGQDYVVAARWYHMATVQGHEFAKISLKQVSRILVESSRDAIHGKRFGRALADLRAVAELGSPEAQLWLGIMLHDGTGTPRDYREAMKWFFMAAEQGNDSAQRLLGVMYRDGLGVIQDYAGALKWFRNAAEQGDADAQNDLGAMFAQGQGVPQDFVLAHMWFNLAASQSPIMGSKQQQEGRERAVKNRNSMAAQMTPTQIAEAQKLAREWWAKHGKK